MSSSRCRSSITELVPARAPGVLQKIDDDALGAGRVAYVVEAAACAPTEAAAWAS